MDEKLVEQALEAYLKKQNDKQERANKEAQKKLEKRLTEITTDIFASFLLAKNASRHCLSCGSVKLRVPERGIISRDEVDGETGEPVIYYYVKFYKLGQSTRNTLSDYEYRVICLNCGHTSLYRSRNVVRWHEQQKRAIQGDNAE